MSTALAVALALALPGAAMAFTHPYLGAVEPAGTVSFKVKKKHGKTRVIKFRFEAVPVTCDAGATTTFGHLKFGVKVKKRKFHAVAVADPPGPKEGSTLHVDGKLRNKSRRAEGELRVFGAAPTAAGTGVNCHTGRRPWTAYRA